MKKSNIIIVAIIIIVLIAAGLWVFIFNKPANNSTVTTVSNSNSSTTAAATITYSGSGFSPGSVTVKSGDSVAIKNDSNTTVQFNSDPHPIHTNDADLNVGTVDPGQTKIFTVTKTGQFGYHNHLDPNQKGTITVN